MSKPRVFLSPLLALGALLCGATLAGAGEPIPDIDVVLEQNPGGIVAVLEPGTAADELVLELPADWVAQPALAEVPAGWTARLVRAKKSVTLHLSRCSTGSPGNAAMKAGGSAGPSKQQMTKHGRDLVSASRCGHEPPSRGNAERRIKASFGQHFGRIAKGATQRITVESYSGGSLLSRLEDVEVDVLAPVATAGSLSGLVRLPPTVSPGETVTASVTDPEALPPGGDWSIGGVVLDSATTAREPEASAIGYARLDDGGETGSESKTLSNAARARHDAAMSTIRNLKVYDVEVAESVLIEEEEVYIAGGLANDPSLLLRTNHNSTRSNKKTHSGRIAVYELDPGGLEELDLRLFAVTELASGEAGETCAGPRHSLLGAGLAASEVHPVDLTECPAPADPPRDLPDDTTLYGVSGAAAAELPHIAAALGLAGESSSDCGTTVITGSERRPSSRREGDRLELDLPTTLAAGGPLAVRYVDQWGRTLLDVPAAEGTEVVPPASGATDPDAPAITGGHTLTTAGSEMCVCGRFPEPPARDGLLLDGAPIGSPPAASSTGIVFVTPLTLEPGPHRVTGDSAAGFAPSEGHDFEALRIEAAVDQEQLLRGGSTQLRIRVAGTERPIELELVNRTPSIIRVEGGDEQTARSSGGAENTITRRLEALSQGAFDLSWTLPDRRCPCRGSSDGG